MPPSPVQITNYTAAGLAQLTSQFQKARPDGIVSPAVAAYYAAGLTLGALASWPEATGKGKGPLAQASVPAQPTVAVDTRDGRTLVRFDSALSLQAAAGALDFVHQTGATILIMMRTRDQRVGATMPILRTSTGAASKGFSLSYDDASSHFAGTLFTISDGSTNVVSEPQAFVYGTIPPLEWTIVAITVTPTRATVTGDGQQAYLDTLATLFPGGTAATPPTLGGGRFEVAALEIYTPLSDTDRDTYVAAMAARSNLAQPVTLAMSPGTTLQPLPGYRYYAFPGMCVAANGNLVACWRNGIAHSGDKGWIEGRTSTDGGATWSAVRVMYQHATLDARQGLLTRLSNGDLLMAIFLSDTTGNVTNINVVIRSTDGGATWSAPVTVPTTFLFWSATAGPIVQRGTKLLLPIYGADSLVAHSSIHIIESLDNGLTWPNEYVVANGVTDVVDYQEPNILLLGDASTLLCVIRVGGATDAKESTSTDGGHTWTALAAGPHVLSATNLVLLSDGTIGAIGRHSNLQASTWFRRVSAGRWSGGWPGGDVDFPTQIDATPAQGLYGQPIEKTPGTISVVYSLNLINGVYPTPAQAEVRFRKIPSYVVRAQDTAAIAISPSAATVAPLGVQGFTSSGGVPPFVFSDPSDPSGGSIGFTGTYTAGAGTGTARPTVTDYVDNSAAANVTVTSAVAPHIISASCKLEIDPAIDGVTDQSGNGNNLTNVGTTAGTGIGGLASTEFDGTAQYISGPVISTFVAAAAWTAYVTFVDRGSPADAGNYFSDATLMGDSSSAAGGYWMVSSAAAKLRFGQSTTTPANVDGLATTIAASTIYRCIFKYDGTKLFVSVNGGAFDAGTVAANIADRTHAIRLGVNQIGAAKYFKGSMGVRGAFNTALAGDPTSVGTDSYKLYQYMLSRG